MDEFTGYTSYIPRLFEPVCCEFSQFRSYTFYCVLFNRTKEIVSLVFLLISAPFLICSIFNFSMPIGWYYTHLE